MSSVLLSSFIQARRALARMDACHKDPGFAVTGLAGIAPVLLCLLSSMPRSKVREARSDDASLVAPLITCAFRLERLLEFDTLLLDRDGYPLRERGQHVDLQARWFSDAQNHASHPGSPERITYQLYECVSMIGHFAHLVVTGADDRTIASEALHVHRAVAQMLQLAYALRFQRCGSCMPEHYFFEPLVMALKHRGKTAHVGVDYAFRDD